MEENKKSKLGLGILIGVLTTLVIGLSAFIIYDKVLTKDNNEQEENENKNEQISDKEEIEKTEIITLDIKSDLVQTTYKSIMTNHYDLGGYNNEDLYLHNNDQLYAKNLSNELKMALTAKKWIEDNSKNPSKDVIIGKDSNGTEFDGYTVPESQVKETYKKLFGNIEYVFVETLIACPGIARDTNNAITIGTGCGGTGMPNIFQEIIKAEKTSDELHIYEVVAYLNYKGESNNQGQDIVDLYKDINKTILVSQNEGYYDYNNTTIDLLKLKDKLNTYKYIFKSNDDGTYYFYSVEKQ